MRGSVVIWVHKFQQVCGGMSPWTHFTAQLGAGAMPGDLRSGAGVSLPRPRCPSARTPTPTLAWPGGRGWTPLVLPQGPLPGAQHRPRGGKTPDPTPRCGFQPVWAGALHNPASCLHPSRHPRLPCRAPPLHHPLLPQPPKGPSRLPTPTALSQQPAGPRERPLHRLTPARSLSWVKPGPWLTGWWWAPRPTGSGASPPESHPVSAAYQRRQLRQVT